MTYLTKMAQTNYSQWSLSDVTQEQIKQIAAYLDQMPLCELVDQDGSDSMSDEYWRKLIKRLGKIDRKYINLLDKSYIRSLEKEAWELKSPSLKLLATLQSRGLQLKVFRSCLEHKEVNCVSALDILTNDMQSPIIVTQPEDCDLDVGSVLKLHCKVQSTQCTSSLQYQWFKGQEPLAKSKDSTYSVQQVELSHAGQYTCRVKNPCIVDPKRAFVFSRTVQVTVHPPPRAPIQETPSEPPVVEVVITTQPKPVNTQYGSGAIFTCRAEGLPGQAITYEWYKDAKKIYSDTSGDLSLPEVTCDNEGQYHCVVICGSCKVGSDRVKLCVELDETDRIEITEHPKDVQAKVNETITLRCVAHNKSNKELVYQWFKDKGNGQVVGSSEFTLPALHFKRDTTCKYYCRVSLKGCNGKFVKSEHAKVTVKVLWFTVEPQDVDGCVGEPAILYCRASGLPGKEITYPWWLKSSTLGVAPTPLPYSSSDTLIIQNLKDSDFGYYICQASDESQFISSRSVHVTAKLQYGSDEEKKIPVIGFIKQPYSLAVEEGKHFSLVCKAVASSDDVCYQWYKEGAMLPGENKEHLHTVGFGSYYCVVKTKKAYGWAFSNIARVSEYIGKPIQNSTEGVHVLEAERSFMLKEGVPFAQEKVALLIGNGHYMSKDIETLKAVESDIRNLHTTLTALEFKVISLVNLKYHEMIKALEQFCMHLQSGVYALFYYSGHGFSCNNATYLIPIDAKNNPLKCCDCISSHTIENHIKGTGAIGIALLDCCKVSDKSTLPPSSSDAGSSTVNSSTYIEISACNDGFRAFADENGSMFNKALVQCLKNKVKVHDLDHMIAKEMRQQCSQRPHRTGTIHGDMTLHDPIMRLLDSDTEKIDLLLQQYSKANSVPDPVSLNIEGEPYVQLVLSFSAEFCNVLKVKAKILPLAGKNISVVVDKEFMKSQGVDVSSDQVSDGTFSFKIQSIPFNLQLPLKLCMTVTVKRSDGQENVVNCVYQLKFSSLI